MNAVPAPRFKSTLVDCALCGSTPDSHRFLVRAHVNARGWPGERVCRMVVCAACGLVFVSPRLERDGYVAFYSSANYEADVEGAPPTASVTERRRAIGARIAEAVEARTPTKPRAVLDVGCGFGDALAEIRDRWDLELAAGVELSEAAVRHACEVYGLDVQQRDLAALDDMRGRFDVVVLSAVLEHTLDPGSVVSAACAALRPDGVLFIRVPDLTRIHLRVWRGDLLQRVIKPVHTYQFSPDTLTALLVKHGAGAVRIERHCFDGRQGELWAIATAGDRAAAGPTAAPPRVPSRLAFWAKYALPWAFSEVVQLALRTLGERNARALMRAVSR